MNEWVPYVAEQVISRGRTLGSSGTTLIIQITFGLLSASSFFFPSLLQSFRSPCVRLAALRAVHESWTFGDTEEWSVSTLGLCVDARLQ